MYADGPAAKLGSSANPGKPLDRISMAANRVDRIADQLLGFVDRFNGNPVCTTDDAKSYPPGHTNSIDHLFDAIERADRLADTISEIG